MRIIGGILVVLFFLVEFARIFINARLLLVPNQQTDFILFGALGILASILLIGAGINALLAVSSIDPDKYRLAKTVFGLGFSVNAIRFIVLNPRNDPTVILIGVMSLVAACYCFYTLRSDK